MTTPTRFRLPAEWDALTATLADTSHSTALSSVLDLARKHSPTSALLEVDYIDADYRNEYSSFYALTFRPLRERCQRLHFFKRIEGGPSERYLGFCVLRPIGSRPVSRTFLEPPRDLLPYVSCLTTTVAKPYGKELRVLGFPFMEQDSQLGVCAHASVWMAALYHHLAHRTPRRFMSDIATAANARVEYWRPTPSDGVSPEQVGAALQEIGLPPVTYAVSRPALEESAGEVVCRYLNSRLPVLLTTRDHVTVLIGYGRDVKGRLFFVRSDDGEAPYVPFYESLDPLGEWDLLFVPLPGRIYLAAESAELIARKLFTSFLRREEHRALRRQLPTYLRLRTYVCRMGDYKTRLRRRGMPSKASHVHRETPTSNWGWVIELQDPRLSNHTRRCVVGEIVIDATSDRLAPNPLFGNLAQHAYTWRDGDPEPLLHDIDYTGPYMSDCALHDAPTARVQPRPSVPGQIRRHARRLGKWASGH